MKRVVFTLTPDQEKRLAALASRMGTSKPQALARAIELYQWLLDVRAGRVKPEKR